MWASSVEKSPVLRHFDFQLLVGEVVEDCDLVVQDLPLGGALSRPHARRAAQVGSATALQRRTVDDSAARHAWLNTLAAVLLFCKRTSLNIWSLDGTDWHSMESVLLSCKRTSLNN